MTFYFTVVAVVVLLRHGKLFDPLHLNVGLVGRRILPGYLGEVFGCGMCLGGWVTASVWLLGLSTPLFALSILCGALASYLLGVGLVHNHEERIASLLVGAILFPTLVAFVAVGHLEGVAGFQQLGLMCLRGALLAGLGDLIVRKLSI